MSSAKLLKFPSHLKELRVHLCPKSPTSQALRCFIEKNYVNLKKSNPSTPILIRECSGVMPKIWARFEMGKESNVSLADVKSDQVLGFINSLVQQN